MNKNTIITFCDKAQNALINEFWDEEDSIFRHRLPCNRNEHFCYWWHAHVIDALLDGFCRTNDNTFIELIDKELNGVFVKNGNTMLNNWYDDMEWMALALLRVWDVTKNQRYLSYVQLLWEDIKTAWNEYMGGGLAWKKDQLDYKNTPANAPAAILAFRLYSRFNNDSDLEWGKKIYSCNRDNLVDPKTGFVWDGMNRLGDGKIVYDWEFTYCQGVMIGAALELYRITDQKQHLDDSIRTALEAKKRLSDSFGGVIPYEGKDDCGLFKGIFIRYVYELYSVCPEVSELREMLESNVTTLIESGISPIGIIGGDWNVQPTDNVDLAQHLSGVMLLEMMAKLN